MGLLLEKFNGEERIGIIKKSIDLAWRCLVNLIVNHLSSNGQLSSLPNFFKGRMGKEWWHIGGAESCEEVVSGDLMFRKIVGFIKWKAMDFTKSK